MSKDRICAACTSMLVSMVICSVWAIMTAEPTAYVLTAWCGVCVWALDRLYRMGVNS